MPSMYGSTPGFDDLLNQWSAQAPGGAIPSPQNISSPWKSFLSYINGPMSGTTAGDDQSLLAYKPMSRLQAAGQTLMGAAQGVLSARGPYRNPLGQGLLGAGQGYQQAQQEDLQHRQQAVNDQYKQMGATLQMANAQAALAKARAEGTHVVGEGQRVVDAGGNVVATGGPKIQAVSEGQRLIDQTTGNVVGMGGPKTGETNGYTYTIGPDGRPTPTAYFPQRPQSIEGYATQAMTGQPQGPQIYGGGQPGQSGGPQLPPNLDPKQAANLLQKFTMLKQPITNVDFRQAQAESAYSTDMGHQSADAYKNAMSAGAVAQKTLDNNKLLRGLADTVDTGPQAAMKFKLQQAASSVGLPDGTIANLTGGQAFNAIAGKSVLDAAGGHFSQGFSDADRNFASSLAASLGNTKEANHVLLDASDEANRRVRAMQGEAIKWEKDHRANGGLYATDAKGRTFDMYMQEYADKNPIYTPQWLKAHGLSPDNPLAGGPAAAPGGSGTPLEQY